MVTLIPNEVEEELNQALKVVTGVVNVAMSIFPAAADVISVIVRDLQKAQRW